MRKSQAKVGAGDTAARRKNAPSRRFWLAIAVLTILLGVLSAAGLWAAYHHIGRTPGELLDFADRRLQGHPRLEALAAPVIAEMRTWLHAPSLAERRKRPFVIPPPPPLKLVAQDSPVAAFDTGTAVGRTLRVGPTAAIRSIAEAARLAQDGDVVEIEAGEYHADVATWRQKKLTIRGVGGNARLFADGKSAEGKAIWVIKNGHFDIANIDFIGARASDRNGAGIRFEDGYLRISNCLFFGNENGLLTAAGNARLEIVSSEFAYNGAGDGLSHNLYVGTIRSLRVEDSYFHHANVGHLLKSRAAENHILYNRLTDEADGRASYELEFPNGGTAYVIGNIIAQAASTENSTIISFGAEGYKWRKNELYLISNTMDNNQPWGGTFLSVKPGGGAVRAVNNLLVGKGTLDSNINGTFANNSHVDWEHFALASRHDYRVKADSPLLRTFVAPGVANGVNLAPAREYVHPVSSRTLPAKPTLPGAQQTLQPENKR